ncbi:hypothetical protein VHUM_01056 [Vanrija humicola]|uniref:Protein kinase domain-containing protein n=1 Tax=Vanrija humicola TaxID=5417 RepID=A0A7D8Z382_VANHU|nr:hypothetical protein VHUM_01056 [Vanrija humicola]
MPPPSYPHRHLLLSNVLDQQQVTQPPADHFCVPGEDNARGCKLDALLLAGWAASGLKGKQADRDALHHVDNLRIKKSDYDVLGRIGEGQFGVVDAVRCKLDGRVYAMKTVEKSMVLRAGGQLGLGNERHIHMLATSMKTAVPAPRLAVTFQTPNALHMVTSYAPCGSLWDRLCEMLPVPGLDTGRMEEKEISWWAKQMVASIAWLHGLGYAHRDIKPHNFLLLADGRLWLTDFGSSAPLTNGSVPKRLCILPAGTPDYVAPEVLRLAEDAMVEAAHSIDDDTLGDRTIRTDIDPPGYGRDIDWWSLGATLYEMSVGRAPFFSPSIGGTYERIMQCDVRLPGHVSQQLKSLLSGLLSPAEIRLGHTDVGEIRRHPFFNGVDWTKQGACPPGIAPQPIDLTTLTDSFEHGFSDMDDVTFDHFFNSSPGLTTAMSHSVSVAVDSAPAAWARWVGWSWDPPTDFFGSEAPPSVSPPTKLTLLAPAPATNMMHTPLRGVVNGGTPPTVPRTAPRSVPRTRAVSERQAFAELVKCVQASARKKLASSAVKIPGSASSVNSSSMSPPIWRKEQPPTPTPMSRDVTALTATMRTFRPLSRTSSCGSDGSQLPSSRGGSLRLRDEAVLAKLGSAEQDESTVVRTRAPRGSSRLGDDTMLAKLLAADREQAENRSQPLPPPPPRPRSRASSVRSQSSRESLRPLTPLSEMPPLGERPVNTISSGTASSRSRDTPGKPAPAAKKPPAPPPVDKPAPPADKYVAPRDPGVGGGDRIAALGQWHRSLEDGLSNLERRLASLRARLEASP